MHQESSELNTQNCQCGCVPKIASLFEMAEKRKKFLELKASQQQRYETIVVNNNNAPDSPEELLLRDKNNNDDVPSGSANSTQAAIVSTASNVNVNDS